MLIPESLSLISQAILKEFMRPNIGAAVNFLKQALSVGLGYAFGFNFNWKLIGIAYAEC